MIINIKKINNSVLTPPTHCNVLHLAEGGDFGVPKLRHQPVTNFDKSTKLDLIPTLLETATFD